MRPEPPDVSAAFERQQRAVRPFTAATTAVGALTVGGSVAALFSDDHLYLIAWVLLVGAGLMAILVVPLSRARRCPNCGRSTGRRPGIFCPVCGARLTRTGRVAGGARDGARDGDPFGPPDRRDMLGETPPGSEKR